MDRGNVTRQPGGGLVWALHPEGRLQVWERPLVGCRYLLSVRGGGAFKLVAGRRERERSVVMVLRKGHVQEGAKDVWQPMRLVARLRPPVVLDPTPIAEIVAAVAEWYGEALCFVEVKDGPIVAKECQRLGAAVQVREVLDKATSEWSTDLGWLTDAETGPATMNALQNAIRESGREGSQQGLRVECDHCLAELATFADLDEAAPAVSFDDDVRTLATAVFNIDSASLYHPDTRARRPPPDNWRVVDAFG